MQTRAIRVSKLGLLTIRPLRNGDTATVAALFARLGPGSHALGFNGAKPHVSYPELVQLARVDEHTHTIVAYVDGDSTPAGIAQVVCNGRDATAAEIAFAVADSYQGSRVGSALAQCLADDARAAGVTRLGTTSRCRTRRHRRSAGASRGSSRPATEPDL